jgi:hypothetical protein
MEIEQARKLLDDVIEIVVKGEHYIGKVDDVEVTYKFGGHTKASMSMINSVGLINRDEVEAFNLEDITKYRLVGEGKWNR